MVTRFRTLTLIFVGAGLLGGLSPVLGQRDCCTRGIESFGYRNHQHYDRAEVVQRLKGQEALGTVQEIVGLLLADPRTDWSNVSIDRLRDYLVDLDLVMMHSRVESLRTEKGLDLRVTGTGDALAAVQRVVPVHAEVMDGFRSWRVSTVTEPDVVRVAITSERDGEPEVIQALGFYGFLASGVHRPSELIALARRQP